MEETKKCKCGEAAVWVPKEPAAGLPAGWVCAKESTIAPFVDEGCDYFVPESNPN